MRERLSNRICFWAIIHSRLPPCIRQDILKRSTIVFSCICRQTRDGFQFRLPILSRSNIMIGTTIGVRKALTITVFALFFAVDGIYSFQSIRPKLSCPQTFQASALFGEKSSSSENSSRKDQQEVEEFLFGSGDGADCVHNIPSDNQISSSLNRKIKELELGIGKRYIIRTQRGFLNVHHEVRRYQPL